MSKTEAARRLGVLMTTLIAFVLASCAAAPAQEAHAAGEAQTRGQGGQARLLRTVPDDLVGDLRGDVGKACESLEYRGMALDWY